jgi:PqqD family protein of HPr-rel-A system
MSGPLWRAPAGRELRWRSWDGEVLVYHANSGDTHRLNAVGGALLRAIDGVGLPAPVLVDRVATTLGVDRATLVEPIGELLTRLEDLGLVESDDEPRSRPDDARSR